MKVIQKKLAEKKAAEKAEADKAAAEKKASEKKTADKKKVASKKEVKKEAIKKVVPKKEHKDDSSNLLTEESTGQKVIMNKKERETHAEQVRNEGIVNFSQSEEEKQNLEIDLEIEAPGAANKVAEEGAKTI